MTRTTLRGGVLKRIFGITLLAVTAASTAQAAVITFEGQSGPAYNQTGFQQSGYTVAFVDPGGEALPNSVLIGRFINGSNPASCGPGNICPTDNPGTYLDLFNSGFVDITANSGAAFRFSGLDASFIASLGVNYPSTPAALQVFGFRADNSYDVIQFNIPDTIAFQRFNAADAVNGADFAQQEYVEIAIAGFSCNARFECSGLDNSPGQIGVDNIVLSDVPATNVPEPASAALVALGLLGMRVRARRRA